MKFRPCIDIHNGCVKQIVGGSLTDNENQAKNNFVSEKKADFYANMYKKDGFKGGHIIILNPAGSTYYRVSRTFHPNHDKSRWHPTAQEYLS